MISMLVRLSRLPGGLVGEHDLGLVDEGAGDGHALLLAARELVRRVVGALARGPPPRAATRRLLVPLRWRLRAAVVERGAARRSRGRVVRGSRLKFWKTKPIFRFRSTARRSLSKPDTSSPSRR